MNDFIDTKIFNNDSKSGSIQEFVNVFCRRTILKLPRTSCSKAQILQSGFEFFNRLTLKLNLHISWEHYNEKLKLVSNYYIN